MSRYSCGQYRSFLVVVTLLCIFCASCSSPQNDNQTQKATVKEEKALQPVEKTLGSVSEVQALSSKAVSQKNSPPPVIESATQEKSLSEQALEAQQRQFYTLQLASFRDQKSAKHFFARALKNIYGTVQLRIEKIGIYYSIRLGQWTQKSEAEAMLQDAVPVFSDAMIVKAFILSQRIIDEKKGKKTKEIQKQVLPHATEPLNSALKEEINQPLSLDTTQQSLVDKEIASHSAPAESKKTTERQQADAQKAKPSERPSADLLNQQTVQLQQPESGEEEVLAPAPPAEGEKSSTPPELPDDEAFVARFLLSLEEDDTNRPLSSPGTLFYEAKAQELYVVELTTQRIVVFGSDYFPQNSIGKGRAVTHPAGGFTDTSGNIYINQEGGGGGVGKLTILNAAFLPQAEYSMKNYDGAEGFQPRRGAVGVDGNIYLAGSYARKVLVVDRKGGFVRWLEWTDDITRGTSPLGKKQKEAPVLIKDVETDVLGNIYLLSEETSKIYVFNKDLEFLFSFGKKGGNRGKMSRPNGLAIDEKHRCIYVVDYMRHTILAFDFTGAYRFSIGGRGAAPGWFNFPIDVAVGARSNLIVADFFNHRAQVFEVQFKKELPMRPKELWKLP